MPHTTSWPSTLQADGNKHVAKVIHLKEQIDLGLRLADQMMERRCLMVTTDSRAQPLATMVRRVISDGATKMGDVDLARMHHVGFCDLSKYGRLTALAIEDTARSCKRVLELNSDFSNLEQQYIMFTVYAMVCYISFYRQTLPVARRGPHDRANIGQRKRPQWPTWRVPAHWRQVLVNGHGDEIDPDNDRHLIPTWEPDMMTG